MEILLSKLCKFKFCTLETNPIGIFNNFNGICFNDFITSLIQLLLVFKILNIIKL